MLWYWDGTPERVYEALYAGARELEGREASPSAAVIDSQTARGASKGAHDRSGGYDAGKKTLGHKRHILVDTLDLLLNVVVHSADTHDRDGAYDLLRRTRRRLRPPRHDPPPRAAKSCV
ncbi:MAG: transposase [Proteobacteria bacterium]|nr:transposase [Pseudomonadota bacterium]